MCVCVCVCLCVSACMYNYLSLCECWAMKRALELGRLQLQQRAQHHPARRRDGAPPPPLHAACALSFVCCQQASFSDIGQTCLPSKAHLVYSLSAKLVVSAWRKSLFLCRTEDVEKL